MKKIIASLTEWPEYQIANQAARAPYFVVLEDWNYIKTISNPFTTGGWAWIAVADLLDKEWCDVFVAGNIWPNMKNYLEQYWIKYEEVNWNWNVMSWMWRWAGRWMWRWMWRWRWLGRRIAGWFGFGK